MSIFTSISFLILILVGGFFSSVIGIADNLFVSIKGPNLPTQMNEVACDNDISIRLGEHQRFISARTGGLDSPGTEARYQTAYDFVILDGKKEIKVLKEAGGSDYKFEISDPHVNAAKAKKIYYLTPEALAATLQLNQEWMNTNIYGLVIPVKDLPEVKVEALARCIAHNAKTAQSAIEKQLLSEIQFVVPAEVPIVNLIDPNFIVKFFCTDGFMIQLDYDRILMWSSSSPSPLLFGKVVSDGTIRPYVDGVDGTVTQYPFPAAPYNFFLKDKKQCVNTGGQTAEDYLNALHREVINEF